MKIQVKNSYPKHISMDVRFVSLTDSSKTYPSTLKYEFPVGSSKPICPNELMDLMKQELRSIEIHLNIDGATRKVLKDDEFIGAKAVEFQSGQGNELVVEFIQKDEEDENPAGKTRDLLPLGKKPAGSSSRP